MKCESCDTREIAIDMVKNEGRENSIWDTEISEIPYRLCIECCDRLKNMALRPLEFFNLAAIHGHSHYLHDDFYDFDTGEATQPYVDVAGAEEFPFPDLEGIKSDLKRLIDYAFVQYITTEIVYEELRTFDKSAVLREVNKRVSYNPGIKYKAYEMISNVAAAVAGVWAKEQWDNRNPEEGILLYAELISKCLPVEEAFEIITSEVEKSGDRTLNENISALLYLRTEKTLGWIERNSERIKNINESWGQLAAGSQFSWQKCEQWLRLGRPLSLIALDALYLCTLTNYAGQSIWLQKTKPRLTGDVNPGMITTELQNYLQTDNAPRAKNTAGAIQINLTG